MKLAFCALNMNADNKGQWIESNCRCDPETNNALCEYCAIHYGLKHGLATIARTRLLAELLEMAINGLSISGGYGEQITAQIEQRLITEAAKGDQ